MSSRKIADMVAYICAKYPRKSELSNARLTKLVYLADWRSVQDNGTQISEIGWFFDQFGPWVPDVIDAARADSRFEVILGANAYGSPRRTVQLQRDAVDSVDALVDGRTREILDLVMAETSGMYFNRFIDYVYQTLPVRETPKGSPLPLASIARDHPAAKRRLPQLVSQGLLTASEYVDARNVMAQQVAERLLDSNWLDRDDPPLTLGRMLLPESLVRSAALEDTFEGELMPGNLIRVTGTARLELSARVDDPFPEPQSYERFGYQQDDSDSDPWSTHVRRAARAVCVFEVIRSDRGPGVRLDQVTLDAPATR